MDCIDLCTSPATASSPCTIDLCSPSTPTTTSTSTPTTTSTSTPTTTPSTPSTTSSIKEVLDVESFNFLFHTNKLTERIMIEEKMYYTQYSKSTNTITFNCMNGPNKHKRNDGRILVRYMYILCHIIIYTYKVLKCSGHHKNEKE